jgi:hypothetical protein
VREFDVHKVPPACRFVPDLGGVAIAVSILVCPRRFAGDVVAGKDVRIRREQRRHLDADDRVKIALGDESDDLVPFVTPGERGMRVDHRDGEKNPLEEKRLWGSPAHMAPGDEIGGPVLARPRSP